jgi:hypothetical protein
MRQWRANIKKALARLNAPSFLIKRQVLLAQTILRQRCANEIELLAQTL